MPLVRQHLTKAQHAQQQHHNRAAQPREFQPGDWVMVLVPNSAYKFLASWQGPYTVMEKISPVTNRVCRPHAPGGRGRQPPAVDGSEGRAVAPGRISSLMCSPRPRVPSGTIVRQRPYRVPEAHRWAIEEEIQQMLKLGVIKLSNSPWSSPIVMVPTQMAPPTSANDFRHPQWSLRVRQLPPNASGDELLDRLGRTRYISTLDLTKGYWQVAPLRNLPNPRRPSAPPVATGNTRLFPFGLHGAPATFQRMMVILLWPHQSYPRSIPGWRGIPLRALGDHLDLLQRVLMELRRAGLTANPRKCQLGLSEAKYLGFQVGQGLIKP